MKGTPERPDAEAEMFFVAAANSSTVWQSVGYELIAAGNLCFRRCAKVVKQTFRPTDVHDYRTSPSRTFLMLYAFALEALLKALWLAQGNRAATTATLETKFRTHDLRRWWKDASMPPPSSDESLILEFLTVYAEIGRYPVRARAQPRDGRRIRRRPLNQPSSRCSAPWVKGSGSGCHTSQHSSDRHDSRP